LLRFSRNDGAGVRNESCKAPDDMSGGYIHRAKKRSR